MISKKIHHQIATLVTQLQKFADRSWYPSFIGFLAGLDNLIIIIPNDGILISSSILTPKRWFFLALSVAIGSTVGAVILATLVEFHGLPIILKYYPTFIESSTWIWSAKFFETYGLLLVFIVAVTPIMQQPAVILAAMANTPLVQLAVIIFVGRFIKFLFMAYVGSHAPRLLKSLWGVRGELEDAGIKLVDIEKKKG